RDSDAPDAARGPARRLAAADPSGPVRPLTASQRSGADDTFHLDARWDISGTGCPSVASGGGQVTFAVVR
ncbi:MAG: hypothetical protein ACK4V6_05290, partial [Microthrixaceae bacterium]